MGQAMRQLGVYLGLVDQHPSHGADRAPDPARPRPQAPAPHESSGATEQVLVGDAANDPPAGSIALLTPLSWGDAPRVGDPFREGSPVIVNLSEIEYADAKRLIDFASGLVFAVHGTLERVTKRVFLLAPPGVQVSAGDTDDSAHRAFYNQS